MWMCVYGLNTDCNLLQHYILDPLVKNWMKPQHLTQSDAVTKIFGSVAQILASAKYSDKCEDMLWVLAAVRLLMQFSRWLLLCCKMLHFMYCCAQVLVLVLQVMICVTICTMREWEGIYSISEQWTSAKHMQMPRFA